MADAEITVPPVSAVCAEISTLATEKFGMLAGIITGRMERVLKNFCDAEGGVLAKVNPEAAERLNGKVQVVKEISFFPLIEGTEVLLKAAERDGVAVAFYEPKIKALVEHVYLNSIIVGVAHGDETRAKMKSFSDAGQTVALVLK